MEGVSHEMVHWIVAHSVPKCPQLIDEGLAVLVSERVVALREGKMPASIRSQAGRPRRMRTYMRRPNRYRLDDVLRLTYRGFKNRGEKGSVFYDLGWCLVATLEKDGEKLGASMRVLFQAMRSKTQPLKTIESLYSMDALERAWLSTISNTASAD